MTNKTQPSKTTPTQQPQIQLTANGRIDITQHPDTPQLPIDYSHPSAITIGIPHTTDGRYWSVYLNGRLITPTNSDK